MIQIDWILIRVQTKYKFKIGDLNNTKNLTSHYITYIEKEIKKILQLAVVLESKRN